VVIDTLSKSSTEDLLTGHDCDVVPFTLQETIIISVLSVLSLIFWWLQCTY